MNNLKNISSIVIALLLIIACYGVAAIIVTTLGIQTVVASIALGYAILRTVRRFIELNEKQ